MENLLDFMLLFRMQPSNNQPTAEQLSAMHQQWSAYIGGIAAQAKLVSTSRLGFEGNMVESSLAVTKGINIANNETLTGNIVIKATSLKEATVIAKSCPVLAMGGSVEVRNTIPM
jgi:hypothetical protein